MSSARSSPGHGFEEGAVLVEQGAGLLQSVRQEAVDLGVDPFAQARAGLLGGDGGEPEARHAPLHDHPLGEPGGAGDVADRPLGVVAVEEQLLTGPPGQQHDQLGQGRGAA